MRVFKVGFHFQDLTNSPCACSALQPAISTSSHVCPRLSGSPTSRPKSVYAHIPFLTCPEMPASKKQKQTRSANSSENVTSPLAPQELKKHKYSECKSLNMEREVRPNMTPGPSSGAW